MSPKIQNCKLNSIIYVYYWCLSLNMADEKRKMLLVLSACWLWKKNGRGRVSKWIKTKPQIGEIIDCIAAGLE